MLIIFIKCKKKGVIRIKTIKSDGHIIFEMSRDNKPILAIDPGETVCVETAKPFINIPDEYFIDSTKLPPLKRRLPITGPIFINGCLPNDVVKIQIKNIELDNVGKAWTGNWIGVLQGHIEHAVLENVEYSEEEIKKLKPLVGTIGVAPSFAPIDCIIPHMHGGNMDVPAIAIGSTVYLVSQVEGGLLALGDVHSEMGIGEATGTGVEIGSWVTLTVDVVKAHPYFQNLKNFRDIQNLQNPFVETKECIVVIDSSGNENESRTILTDIAINLIAKINNITFSNAVSLFVRYCSVITTQFVNINPTVIVTIPKRILN